MSKSKQPSSIFLPPKKPLLPLITKDRPAPVAQNSQDDTRNARKGSAQSPTNPQSSPHIPQGLSGFLAGSPTIPQSPGVSAPQGSLKTQDPRLGSANARRASASLRRPSTRFYNTNGFLPPVPEFPTPEEHVTDYDIEQHEFAQYVLKNNGSYCPSLQDMIAMNERANTSSAQRERIAEVEAQYTQDLKSLCEYQAERFHDDAFDRYAQLGDELHWQPKKDGNLEEERMTYLDAIVLDPYYLHTHGHPPNLPREDSPKFMQMPHSAVSLSAFDDELDITRYAHQLQLIDMKKKLAQTIAREYANFPVTVEAFRALEIANPEFQVVVARFVSDTDAVRKAMVNENGWAWRQTTPLTTEYGTNREFAEEVQRILTHTSPQAAPAVPPPAPASRDPRASLTDDSPSWA